MKKLSDDKKIVRSIRADESTYSKFKSVCEELGGQQEGLTALLNAYELQQAKGILTGQATNIDDFTSRTGTTVAGYVERSIVVQQSELYGKTVIEANPTSKQADIYRNLAKHIAENEDLVVPNPLSSTELRDWARDWGDKIYNLKADAAGPVAAQA